MAFAFNINTQAAVNTGKGGAMGSGVHTVTIQEAWLGETKNGNNIIDLELVSDSGERATIYGMCIDETFTTGSKNSSYGVWNELAIVAGMQTGAVAPMERTAFDGSKSQENAFTELMGKKVMIGLQIVHDVNQDKNKEVKRRNLYRAFYADGRSVAEVQAGETVAKSSAGLKIEDYVTKDCEAFRAGAVGVAAAPVGVAPVAAPVMPVAPVAPIAAPVAAPVAVAPVAQPVAVAPVAAPVAAPVQPAVAVAQAMPVANPALGGQF